MKIIILLWAALAMPLLAQNQGGGITQPGASTQFATSSPTAAPYSPCVVGAPNCGTLSYQGVLYTCAGATGASCNYATTTAASPSQPASTITCNNTGSTSAPAGCTPAQTAAVLGNAITYSQLGGANPAAAGAALGATAAQPSGNSSEPQAVTGGKNLVDYSYIASLSGAVGSPQTVVNATKIRVSDYGIINDSTTDQTTKLNNLFANAPPGAQIEFPCTTSGNYIVNGTVNFAANHVYLGSAGRGFQLCNIQSNASASSAAAFNLVGVDSVVLQNLRLLGVNSGSPPKTILMMGRGASTLGSHNTFDNVVVQGYASSVLIYSIGSEEQRWFNPGFFLSGGGGSGLYYTADTDILGICSACYPTTTSNGDNRFYGIHGVDFSTVANSCMFTFNSLVGETKDDAIFGGYLANNQTSSAIETGFCFPNSVAGTITVDNVRIENPIYFASTGSSAGVPNLRLTSNTMAAITGSLGFVNSPGGTQSGWIEMGNRISNGSGLGSVIHGLSNSFISEVFPVTVTTNQNSLIQSSTNNSLLISSLLQLLPTGSQPTCAVGIRGAIWPNQSGTPDFLQVCDRTGAGTYAWQNLNGAITVSALSFTGTAPTCTVGASAGTGATCSVTGTNQAAVVTLNTGTVPSASGTAVTITYSGTVATAPTGCTMMPRNAATAGQISSVFTTAPSTTSYTIGVDTIALPASTSGLVWYVPCT